MAADLKQTQADEVKEKDSCETQLRENDIAKQMKVASEEREAENKEFQTAVTEQRAAQDVLSKALARLKVFYEGGASAKAPSLVQQVLSGDATPGAAAPPEPKGFDKYENNRGATGVMTT